MNIWWLAIDRDYTSYQELKYRKVVAQGWPKLGDLSILTGLVEHGYKDEFVKTIDALNQLAYSEIGHASKVMLSLLSMKGGDLVVGIEGTTVKGICQLSNNGFDSYQLLSPSQFNYAQTVDLGVRWYDWNHSEMGNPPITPSQSVQGIAGLKKEYDQVKKAWDMVSR